jgi:hypothetical protein
MAWEPGRNKYTLLLQKVAQGKTKVYMFMRVTTIQGTVYLEPVPSETLSLRDIAFDDIQFFEHPGIRRDEFASELALTGTHPDQSFGGRKA